MSHGPPILELLPLGLTFFTGRMCKYTPVIWEVETGGWRIEGQPGLHRETIFKKKSFYHRNFDRLPIDSPLKRKVLWSMVA